MKEVAEKVWVGPGMGGKFMPKMFPLFETIDELMGDVALSGTMDHKLHLELNTVDEYVDAEAGEAWDAVGKGDGKGEFGYNSTWYNLSQSHSEGWVALDGDPEHGVKVHHFSRSSYYFGLLSDGVRDLDDDELTKLWRTLSAAHSAHIDNRPQMASIDYCSLDSSERSPRTLKYRISKELYKVIEGVWSKREVVNGHKGPRGKVMYGTLSVREIARKLNGKGAEDKAVAKAGRVVAAKERNRKRVVMGELLGQLVNQINANGADLKVNHDMTVRDLLLAMTLESES